MAMSSRYGLQASCKSACNARDGAQHVSTQSPASFCLNITAATPLAQTNPPTTRVRRSNFPLPNFSPVWLLPRMLDSTLYFGPQLCFLPSLCLSNRPFSLHFLPNFTSRQSFFRLSFTSLFTPVLLLSLYSLCLLLSLPFLRIIPFAFLSWSLSRPLVSSL